MLLLSSHFFLYTLSISHFSLVWIPQLFISTPFKDDDYGKYKLSYNNPCSFIADFILVFEYLKLKWRQEV